MPQLSLYLDEPTMEMLREKSSREGRGWPSGYWDNVYGCLRDPTFVVPEEEGDLDEIVLFA